MRLDELMMLLLVITPLVGVLAVAAWVCEWVERKQRGDLDED